MPKVSNEYAMKIHKNGKYLYASTQPIVSVNEDGSKNYKRIHWGILDENLKFIPNKNFLMLSKRDKLKYKFPENWDVTEVFANVKHKIEQSYNLLYGDIWLLENIVEQLGIKEDLLTVFDNDAQMVNAMLTLIFYRICSDDSYSQIKYWQRVTKVPYEFDLDDVFISRLTRKITENHKLEFIKLRLNRIDKDEICAIDSTSVSCTNNTLVDAFYGYNKEGDKMYQTNEVVVYGLKSKLPLYYRTMPGNMYDSKSLQTIVNDLMAIGLKNCLMITDRGYESTENVAFYKKNKIPFIAGIKSTNSLVLDSLKYDGDINTLFFPEKMDVDPNTGMFGRQYSLDGKHNGLSVNIYVDMKRRTNTFVDVKREVSLQKKILHDLFMEDKPCDKERVVKSCSFFNVKFRKEGKFNHVSSYDFDEAKFKRATYLSGIFANVSYGLSEDVFQVLDLYTQRAEQEKVFMLQKTFLNSRRHRTGIDETKIGRNFILFIASIICCHLTAVRKEQLADTFSDIKGMLREMRSVRYIRHKDKEDYITPFVSLQSRIAEAFGFKPIGESKPNKYVYGLFKAR
jgi:hypothetical protein